ncbi:hypothetical protein FPRO03_11868 [Fusarium proliferatum]|nr:hypothetical protein FPRO03_11868 [Fusarium proliferatum]
MENIPPRHGAAMQEMTLEHIPEAKTASNQTALPSQEVAQDQGRVFSPQEISALAALSIRISVEAMRECNTYQCLLLRDESWEPEDSELEDFERQDSHVLSGLADAVKSNRRGYYAPQFFPERNKVRYTVTTFLSDGVPAMPFHPTCFEVFKRASIYRYGFVNVKALVSWAQERAAPSMRLPEHAAVKRARQMQWMHHAGDEFLAANPCFIPGLQDIIDSVQNIYSPDDICSDAAPPALNSTDMFSKLPQEIKLEILLQLDSWDIASLRLSSRAFRHLPQSLFYQLTLRELPWLYEAWAPLPLSFFVTTTAVEQRRIGQRLDEINQKISVRRQDDDGSEENAAEIKRLANRAAKLEERRKQSYKTTPVRLLDRRSLRDNDCVFRLGQLNPYLGGHLISVAVSRVDSPNKAQSLQRVSAAVASIMTGRVPNVWAAIIIPVPASALALVLRIKARRMTKMGVGYDDALSIAAWFVALGYAILLIVWTTCYYMGRKIGHFPEDKIDHILEKSHEILFASEILYSWSIFLSKMSVLTFYRRIFQFSSIRVPIIILMVCCGCWITIRTFMTIFHCMPVQAYWDKSIDGKCMNNIGQYYLGTDLTHCLMDFIILALPLFEVVRMKLILGQKIAVIGIFSLGSLVGIASIFQIVEAQKYTSNSREFPYDFSLAMVWANVEVHLAVFTSCLALLRPIFRKFIPGLSSGNTTYPANGLSHASNTYTNSIALRRSRSPRDVEEVIEGQRAYAYLDYDAISLPGAKDVNSISRLQEREHHTPSMTESGGRGSLSSQNSVR